jgi:beta-galactosidase beta subunit
LTLDFAKSEWLKATKDARNLDEEIFELHDRFLRLLSQGDEKHVFAYTEAKSLMKKYLDVVDYSIRIIDHVEDKDKFKTFQNEQRIKRESHNRAT